MTIKLLQLNIQKGSHLDNVVAYIQKHKFDVVCLQEVAGGSAAKNKINCFEYIQRKTGYRGELSVFLGASGDLTTFIGNATLWTDRWSLLSSHTVWLKRYKEVSNLSAIDYRHVPRSALCLVLENSGNKLLIVNTHLAWGPTADDALYKRNQAEKLYLWLKRHAKIPFILTGDFNLNPHTMIVTKFSQLGNNLIKRYGITNTLNPRTHYAKHLFPSGIPVDYIIIDRRLSVDNFFVEENVDLSDHFGLVMECTI